MQRYWIFAIRFWLFCSYLVIHFQTHWRSNFHPVGLNFNALKFSRSWRCWEGLKKVKNLGGRLAFDDCRLCTCWIFEFAEIAQNLMERPTNGSRTPFKSHWPLFSGQKKMKIVKLFWFLDAYNLFQEGLFFKPCQ